MHPESRRAFLQRLVGLSIAAGSAGLTATGCSLAPTQDKSSDLRRLGDWKLFASPGASFARRHDSALGTLVTDVTTGTTGGEARLICQRTGPVSLDNRILKLWIKLESSTARDVNYVAVKVASGTAAFQNYAYEEILATGGPQASTESYLLSTIKPGQWTPVTLGPASFVGLGADNAYPVDFEALQDFELAIAAEPGTHATLSFGGAEVIDGDARFPRGVVSITFDDGLSSPFRLGLPILAAHGFPATAFVIRDLIGTAGANNGSYMSIDQLRVLQQHGWEIGAHANLIADHNHYLGFAGLTRSTLISDVTDEVAWLRSSGFNGARDIALPQGWFNEEVQQVLSQYGRFETIRSVDFRTVETLPVADPLRLRARLYDHTVPVAPATVPGTFQWKVDQIARYGGWLIIGFHDMVPAHASLNTPTIVNEGSAVLDSDFRELVDYIAERGVPVKTVREVWESQPGTA